MVSAGARGHLGTSKNLGEAVGPLDKETGEAAACRPLAGSVLEKQFLLKEDEKGEKLAEAAAPAGVPAVLVQEKQNLWKEQDLGWGESDGTYLKGREACPSAVLMQKEQKEAKKLVKPQQGLRDIVKKSSGWKGQFGHHPLDFLELDDVAALSRVKMHDESALRMFEEFVDRNCRIGS